MTTRFHVGAKALSSTIDAYAKRFDLLEVRLADRAPTEASLRRYRKNVPPHFEFVVVVPPAVAALKPSAAFDAGLAQTKGAVTALQARTVLVSTPPEVTPAAVWRDRMKSLLAALPRDASQVVWEPHGVWEIEEAARVAKRWDVVLSVDAAREEVPPGPVAYVRLPTLGAARSYSEAILERVVQRVGDRREAFVVIETSSALKECKTLRRLAQGPGKRAPKGGGGLVIRPRATALRVRDDEQE
ncbi:MAG: DUF72 domain-containing protein [Polyangiaceae bacterium]